MPSLFTKLIAGEIPAEFVFTDDRFVAFMDICPVHPGHCLLVPRSEVQYLADLPEADHAALGQALARLIRIVKQATGCPAVNVLVNDGPEANQAVPHAHVHVIPRWKDDRAFAHPKGTPYAEGGMAAWATKLRSHA